MLKQANTLPEKIRFIRQELHLSRQGLSELVNVSESSIRHYESGLRSPSDGVIQRLSTLSGLSHHILVDDSNHIRRLNTDHIIAKRDVLEYMVNEAYGRGVMGVVKDMLNEHIVNNKVLTLWDSMTEDQKSRIIVEFLENSFDKGG